MSSAMVVLEAQVREAYGRVTFAHKTHEKAADLLTGRAATIKWIQIVLAALTTGGIISELTEMVGDVPAVALLTGAVSATLFGLNIYAKTERLGELAQMHRTTARTLWLIRERYLGLLADIRAGDLSLVEIRVTRDSLRDDLSEVYSSAPSTWSKAYGEARRALKVNGEMTFTDDELDNLLPPTLRRSLKPG